MSEYPNWKCSVCNREFGTFDQLQRHFETEHFGTEEWVRPEETPLRDEPDLAELKRLVVGYVLEVRTKRQADEDYDNWISEAAIEAFYGKAIWSEINALMCC